MVHEECLTGLTAWKATIYPSPLSWGASFDPELVQEVGAQIGRTLRRLGVHQGLAPVLDVVRDLRWGRVEETIGEDPFLVGTIGSAYVRGLESEGIVATLKHFVGYSSSRAGRNFAPVSVGRRELADVLLPPFEMALRDGARSVMNSYTDIDGVPVAADETLLTGLLRDAGFTGTVVSDYSQSVSWRACTMSPQTWEGGRGWPSRPASMLNFPTSTLWGRARACELVESGEVDALGGARSQASPDAEVRTWAPRPRLVRRTSCPSTRSTSSMARRAKWPEVGRALDSPAFQRRLPAFAPGPPRQRGGPFGFRIDAMLGCYSFPMHVGAHHPDLPVGVDLPAFLDAMTADPAGYKISYTRAVPWLVGNDEEQPVCEASCSRLRYLRCSPR